MIPILVKEFNGFLNSLIAYIVIGVFLCAMGLLMWVFPETSVLDYGYADMETLFYFGPYVLLFLIPAITMRSFAEEKKTGTLELLFTKPLTDTQIVGGKYLASFLLVIVALSPTVLYYFSVYFLGDPIGNVDTAAVIGSYIGLALLGGVFCSIGIFASSVSSNQIVSYILAAFLCYILFAGFESIALLSHWTSVQSLTIKQWGMFYHYASLSKGLVDSRDMIYFFSLIFFMLLLTKTVLKSRSW